MIMDDTYKINFERMQSDYNYWLNKSTDLIITAKTLFDSMNVNNKLQINCLSPAYMIAGMAYEMLFKAIIVRNLEKPKPIHILTTLADDAGYACEAGETKLLTTLTEFILWDGRYPTPKDASHLQKHWQNMQQPEFSVAKSNVVKFEPNDGYPDFERMMRVYRKIYESCGLGT